MTRASSVRVATSAFAVLALGAAIRIVVACSSFGEDASLADASTGDAREGAICPAGFADCDGDGNCETPILAEDARNCGACGRTCAACGAGCESAKCNKGRCEAVLVAANQSSPGGIIADDAGIYWVNGPPNGAVMAAPHGGGASSVVVAALDPKARRVAVDDAAIYWTSDADGPDNAIRKTARSCMGDAGCIGSLASVDHVFGIAVQGSVVYFTGGQRNANDGFIGTISTDVTGATVTKLIDRQSNPYEIAVDDSSVYWTALGGTDEFQGDAAAEGAHRLTKPPCKFVQDCVPGRLVRAQTRLGIAVDTTHVYLATSDTDAGSVIRVPKGDVDSGVYQTLASPEAFPASLAVDDAYIYWVNRVGGSRAGSIKRMPRDGKCKAGVPCPEVLVAPGGPDSDVPSGIVVRAETVYFTTAGTGANNGAVWKMAR